MSERFCNMITRDIGDNKNKIKQFFIENNRLPLKSRKYYERKLNSLLIDYCSPISSAYDKKFAYWARSKGLNYDSLRENVEKIWKWSRANTRRPSSSQRATS